MIALIASIGLYHLQSECARYDGQNLILTEAVEVDHPLGQINAQSALVEQIRGDKSAPFQKITFTGQVCLHAQTNQRTVNIFSYEATGELGTGELFAFQQLDCTGNVEVSTSDGFIATGGHAHYSALVNRGGIVDLVPSPLVSHCILSHLQDHLEAHKVRFEVESGRLICTGNVHLISHFLSDQPCFAIADQAIYNAHTDTAILLARPGRHVLFWKRDGSMRLSAPEVHLRRDQTTKQQVVQGIGDVHFRFTIQEENLIETFFAKYL